MGKLYVIHVLPQLKTDLKNLLWADSGYLTPENIIGTKYYIVCPPFIYP